MKSIWNIIKSYKKYIITFLVLAVLIYVIIYCCFFTDGFLSAGKDLEKKDWLSFLGSYLSFIGTLAVSMVALLQGIEYDKRDKNRRRADRINQIQPIFSVEYVQNAQIDNTVEPINLKTGSSAKHDNMAFTIENVGAYPISHVIIFDKYLLPMMKPGDKKRIYVAYEDSIEVHKTKVIKILESEYERKNGNMPTWFNICYEDVDGNEMFQTFELNSFDKDYYYSLTNKEYVDNNKVKIKDIDIAIKSK